MNGFASLPVSLQHVQRAYFDPGKTLLRLQLQDSCKNCGVLQSSTTLLKSLLIVLFPLCVFFSYFKALNTTVCRSTLWSQICNYISINGKTSRSILLEMVPVVLMLLLRRVFARH